MLFGLQFSKPITSEEGKDIGLVDAVVPSGELLNASRQWALDIIERRKPWIRSLHRIDKLGSLPEVVDNIKTARQQAKQTFKNLPQHQACLDVIEEGIIRGGYHGLLKVILFLTWDAKVILHNFVNTSFRVYTTCLATFLARYINGFPEITLLAA